jgi:hypothetical protein
MYELGRLLREVAQGIVSALLPAPEREQFARRHGLDPPRWSALLGLGQLASGLPLFLYGGLTFMQIGFDAPARALLENWWPGLESTHFQGAMMLAWFAWFVHPASWPLQYLALVGLARCLAFAISREAIGEPVVWAAVRVGQRLGVFVERRTLHRRLGPWRRDRIVQGGGSDLVVFSAREKPAWTPGTTVEFGDRFFQIIGRELRPDRGFESYTYRLHQQDPAEIIRRLVRYDGPVESDGDRG